MATSQQNTAHPRCHCRVIDAFRLAGGRIIRDAETESWRELVNPMVVDIDSGMIQLGAQSVPLQWEILQRDAPGWDFVAKKREGGGTVLSTLRIRLWESTVQVLLTINGFTFVSGICEISESEESGT
jgi:hypothetical protein